MKTLLLILMLMPLFLAAQINKAKSDSTLHLVIEDWECLFTESKEIQFMPINFKGQDVILQCDTVKENFDSKDEYGTLYLVDQLGKYFEECYKDSFQVDIFVDPNTRTEIAPGIFNSTSMGGGYYKK